MKKLLTLLLFTGIPLFSFGQIEKEISKWTFGLSVSPDSYRYAQAEDNGLYYQPSFDHHLSDYLVLGGYLGIQNRKSGFTSEYPIPPYTTKEINYERQYIPLGVRIGFDLSSFFSNQLGWIKDEPKWEILLLGYGGLTVMSENILTPIDEGEAIEWSEYEAEEDMNYIAGVNAVIRYYPTKNCGLFTELGYGPVGRYSLGVSYRLF
ncbi:hypothetical protein [Algoriphagus terrigena]|uniref:hypothetical protein n=1 Tax=Algoriphagus terrigena TaxID=344884 RepID=UPI0004001C34|nr:hypothetical protein [Algoriphagus terrigena]